MDDTSFHTDNWLALWFRNNPYSAGLLWVLVWLFFSFLFLRRIIWINKTWHIWKTPTPYPGTWGGKSGAPHCTTSFLPLADWWGVGGGDDDYSWTQALVQVHEQLERFFFFFYLVFLCGTCLSGFHRECL